MINYINSIATGKTVLVGVNDEAMNCFNPDAYTAL